MPELPEVETVVRDLKPLLAQKKIGSVKILGKKLRRPWNPLWTKSLEKQTLNKIHRRGKWIILSMKSGVQLLIHLGMTGQLCVFDQQEALKSHTNLVFKLSPGNAELRFRDVRRFGSADVFDTEKELQDFFAKRKLGPEPFNLSQEYWLSSLAKSSRNLKAFLLDQQNIVGVGNIYADESLHKSRLHPSRLACSLKPYEAILLSNSIEEILNAAIKNRGSTIRNYVGGAGLMGGYQDEFKAYGRTGLPCMNCGNSIQKIVLAGRSSHFCPNCQPKKPSKR